MSFFEVTVKEFLICKAVVTDAVFQHGISCIERLWNVFSIIGLED